MKDNGNGTCWVAPGEGATLRSLSDAASKTPQQRSAAHRLTAVARATGDWRKAFGSSTNLALTGEPLTALDLERIASDNLEVE